MELSVIVPVYNAEKYIAQCLDSICRQTLTDIEIILIDDGSTDSSGDICRVYAEQDTRILYVRKENQGACYARLDGLKRAKADYVAFVDSDDWIDTSMYSYLLSKMKEHKADIITSGFVFDEDGERITDLFPEGVYKGEHSKTVFSSMIFDEKFWRSGMTCSVCNKIFRRELLLKYMEQIPEGLRVWEDLAYAYHPFFDAQAFVITHKTFYHYRQNEQSTSHRVPHDIYEKTKYAFAAAEKCFGQQPMTIQKQFFQLAANCMFVVMAQMYQSGISNKQMKAVYCDSYWKHLYQCVDEYNIFLPQKQRKFWKLLLNSHTNKARFYLGWTEWIKSVKRTIIHTIRG